MSENITVTREMSTEAFNTLPPQYKQKCYDSLVESKINYTKFGGIHRTDFPYYFWSTFKDNIFKDIPMEEVNAFLGVTDVDDFSTQVVYYVAKYLHNTKR